MTTTDSTDSKRFATMQAKFALMGHTLHRSVEADGAAPVYLAERWGLVRYLPTLEDADKFLLQVGGGNHE